METRQRTIALGALADPISKQFPEIPTDRAEMLDRFAEAIILLGVYDIITPSERAKARKRLIRRVESALNSRHAPPHTPSHAPPYPPLHTPPHGAPKTNA